MTKLEFGKEPPLPLKRHTVTSSIGEPILESSIADGEKVQVAVNTMYQFTNSERFMLLLVLFIKDITILISFSDSFHAVLQPWYFIALVSCSREHGL